MTKKEKQELEVSAMEKIKRMLPLEIGNEIFKLWEEYEKGETDEAKYIKALDKIETLTQLIETGNAFYKFPEFIPNYADKAVNNFPALIPMLEIVKSKLKLEFERGNIEWKKEYDNMILS